MSLYCINVDQVWLITHKLCKFCKNDRTITDFYENIASDKALDFTQGMNSQNIHLWALQKHPSFAKKISPFTAEFFWNFLVWLYSKNNLVKVEAELQVNASLESSYKIPRIIHQIWFDGPLTEQFKKNQQSWIQNHSDWQYKLWTKEEIKELGLPPTTTIAKIVCEILYKFGGVYIDSKFESLYPLSLLHHSYDFYATLKPLDTLYLELGDIIGTIPKHPIIAYAKDLINNSIKLSFSEIITKAFLITAPKLEGYIHDFAPDNASSKNVIFPANFFYPLGYTQQHCSDKHIKKMINGSFTLYHWSNDETL